MKINDKVYDVLKWVCILFLPALASLYNGLANIWGLPFGMEITKTLDLVGTFLGIIIGVTTISYNKDDGGASYDFEDEELVEVVEDDGED